jgi:DNA-binding transcriptional ArsR family regulator
MEGISFAVPQDATDRIAFSYSPLCEAILSLHVLVEPKHHPVQQPWVRHARSLPATLQGEIAAFGFAYRSYFPAFLYPRPTGTFSEFDDELALVAGLSDRTITFEFTRSLASGRAPRDPARVDDPTVREQMAEVASRLPGSQAEVARLALDDPAELVRRFLALLADYWDQAFRSEWERVEPLLHQAIVEAGRSILAHGLYGFFQQLVPELRVDSQSGRVSLERTHQHDVIIGDGQHLVLAPSMYVWPHVRANCDDPWPPALVYPAPAVESQARPPIPPEELLAVLRAVGDDTRLRTLRLIAERPRSTQELAPLVGISQAAMSKHLRTMAQAGLLSSNREGYFVLYRLEPAQLQQLSQSLQDFLRYREASTNQA